MIEVNNLTGFRVNKDFLKKIAQKVLANEKKNKTELSIALVGLKRIKELNKKYRGKNRATDVLSFSYDGSGDIVICLGEVKENAKRFGTTFKKELAICLIHGILHLLGYGHEKSEGETEAKKVEETKASSSPTELPKEAKVRKRVKSSFAFAAARVVEEDKSSSSPFAAARVVKEDKSSFPPSLSPRESSVMEEKQNYYLKICQGVIS